LSKPDEQADMVATSTAHAVTVTVVRRNMRASWGGWCEEMDGEVR
jgi:hypothetical protein